MDGDAVLGSAMGVLCEEVALAHGVTDWGTPKVLIQINGCDQERTDTFVPIPGDMGVILPFQQNPWHVRVVTFQFADLSCAMELTNSYVLLSPARLVAGILLVVVSTATHVMFIIMIIFLILLCSFILCRQEVQ